MLFFFSRNTSKVFLNGLFVIVWPIGVIVSSFVQFVVRGSWLMRAWIRISLENKCIWNRRFELFRGLFGALGLVECPYDRSLPLPYNYSFWMQTIHTWISLHAKHHDEHTIATKHIHFAISISIPRSSSATASEYPFQYPNGFVRLVYFQKQKFSFNSYDMFTALNSGFSLWIRNQSFFFFVFRCCCWCLCCWFVWNPQDDCMKRLDRKLRRAHEINGQCFT